MEFINDFLYCHELQKNTGPDVNELIYLRITTKNLPICKEMKYYIWKTFQCIRKKRMLMIKDKMSAHVDIPFIFLNRLGIVNISPLKDLVNLKYIYLDNNQIMDISPLKNLVNLEDVNLDNNQIVDISPLKNLVNLKYLHLDNNQIVDISPLKDLVNLKYIYIDNNQIMDIPPLEG